MVDGSATLLQSRSQELSLTGGEKASEQASCRVHPHTHPNPRPYTLGRLVHISALLQSSLSIARTQKFLISVVFFLLSLLDSVLQGFGCLLGMSGIGFCYAVPLQ